MRLLSARCHLVANSDVFGSASRQLVLDGAQPHQQQERQQQRTSHQQERQQKEQRQQQVESRLLALNHQQQHLNHLRQQIHARSMMLTRPSPTKRPQSQLMVDEIHVIGAAAEQPLAANPEGDGAAGDSRGPGDSRQRTPRRRQCPKHIDGGLTQVAGN